MPLKLHAMYDNDKGFPSISNPIFQYIYSRSSTSRGIEIGVNPTILCDLQDLI